jgi:hypothetical protein
MTEICNDILFFFDKKEKELEPLLKRFEKYMICHTIHVVKPLESIHPIQSINTQIQSIKQQEQPLPASVPVPLPSLLQVAPPQTKQIPKKDFMNINKNDTLFWCLFIAKYGYQEYIMVDRNYGVKELEIKSKVADFIRSNAMKMKMTNYKMTKVLLQEIMSDLMTTQKHTSIYCMIAMIVYFEINVVIVDSKSKFMWEFISNKEVENENMIQTFLIKKDDSCKYSLKEEPITKEELNKMKKETICLENFMKPIKSMSAYNVVELHNLADKMKIVYDKNKKIKKEDLYREIQEIISKEIKW